MADALPKGLVTTKRNVLSNLNVMDRVDIEDILLLWKGVYYVHLIYPGQHILRKHELISDDRPRQCTPRALPYLEVIWDIGCRISSGEFAAVRN